MVLFTRLDTALCLVITIFIGLISYLGDWLLYNIKNSTFRAIADNLTHALVGCLSWTLVIKLSKNLLSRNVIGITVCFLISSLIDLDHFFLARSWKLSDANHLGSQRPIFHCSVIPVLIWLIFVITYKIFNLHSTVGYYCWVIITGFVSHQMRDANRRGLWFGYIGSTPPIPYYFYIFTAMVLPYIIYWLIPDYVIKDCQVFSLDRNDETNRLPVYDV